MKTTVLLSAAAKDAAESSSIEIEVSDHATAQDVIDGLATRLPAIAGLLPSSRLAVDCNYVNGDAPISPSSEIALIPPVSGG